MRAPQRQRLFSGKSVKVETSKAGTVTGTAGYRESLPAALREPDGRPTKVTVHSKFARSRANVAGGTVN